METSKLLAYQNERLKKGSSWLLFLFLGWSYGSMDKIGLQILYYITLGGFGVWALVRLFTLNSAIKSYNRKVAAQVGLTTEEITSLNIL